MLARIDFLQAEALYIDGAVRLGDELRADSPAAPPAAKGHDWTRSLPPRAEFVADRLRAQAEGGESGAPRSAAEWGEAWDLMDAKLKAHRGE